MVNERMTARPMTEVEREEALRHAQFIDSDCLASMTATGPEVQRLACALLSTSSSEQRMKEALTLAEDVLSRAPFSTQMWPNGMHPHTGITRLRAALSPTPTDTKDTSK